MKTFGDLRMLAEENLFGERYDEALVLYTRLVELRPEDLDARMRVGDALMARGAVQSAAVIYTSLAQHSARAGYPLRALVALKVLSTLEPQLGVLLDDVARLYARDSELIGRGVRRSPPDPNQALPDDWAGPEQPLDGLEQRAVAIASQYRAGALFYPDKLMPIPLLSLLPAQEFATALHAVKLVRARPGTAILRQGEPGQSFFIVARGRVTVSRRDDAGAGEEQTLATLHDGAIFGEMALLSADPRTATVTAASDCDLLEFDRDAMTAASATLSSMETALATFARERLLQNVLSTAGLFKPLAPPQKTALIRRFVAVNVEAGTQVIREGQAGQGLYVVLRGEVIVSKDDGTGSQELARLGPAEAFGEISLLNDEPTTATVTASSPSTLLFLGKDYFQRLVAAVPEVRAYLEQISDDRMMDTRLSFEPGGGIEPLSQADLDAMEHDIDEIEVEVLV